MKSWLPECRDSASRQFRRGLPAALVAAAALALLWPARLLAASFTATLDRDTVEVGDSATLTLTFDGAAPRAVPSPPPVPGLQITPGGTSRNVSIVNSETAFSYSQSFLLTPTAPGDYVIPSLKAEVEGKFVASQPLKLKAVKGAAVNDPGAGGGYAFLRLLVPRKEVYLGEVFAVQLQFFMREDVANGDGILQSFERMGNALIKADGFSVLKTACTQRRRVQIGGAVYVVSTAVTSLSPVKTGPLTVDAINTTITLQLPIRNQRRDFFDPLGMFQRYEEKRVPIAAETETVTALALPADAPAGFNGAVGTYTMEVLAGPTNVAVGDPITVKIQIAGSGALDALALPEQPAWRGFKMYPPTSKIDTTDPLGIAGAKIFEQVVVPESADLKALPPVAFTYFDSGKKSYQALAGPTISLIVRPAGAAAVPVTSAGSRQDTPAPARDVVPIKQRLGEMAVAAPPLVRQPWFLVLQGAPALALLGAVAWRRSRDNLAANPRLRRQRRVARIVRDGLNELRKCAAANNSDAFFATLFRLLQEKLGERLDLPASAITEAVIEEHLRPRGVSEPALKSLQELFQTCNLARYAPIKSSQELAAFIPKLEAILRQLQQEVAA